MRDFLFFFCIGLIFLIMWTGVAYAKDNTGEEQAVCEMQFSALPIPENPVVVFDEIDWTADWKSESDRLKDWLANRALSGDCNVIKVKTIYRSGYLFSVEILYDASGRGTNYGVMFSPDNGLSGIQRSAFVRTWVSETLTRGKVRVVDIQTIYKNGLLYSAEIYYLKE